MSDNYLLFIPQDPTFVPSLEAQSAAEKLFKIAFPLADEFRVETSERIVFFDCGGNFESARCPACNFDLLPGDEWNDLMDVACAGDFENLILPMPCCGGEISLNDVRYSWPAGFGRFSLWAMNPGTPDIAPRPLAELEAILGCELRIIWRRL